MAYTVDYQRGAQRDLRGLTRRERAIVQATVIQQLTHEPTVPTKNRRPMDPNPLAATWELRIGDLRVYYDVADDENELAVIAVGTKERERVRLGRGQIIDLRSSP